MVLGEKTVGKEQTDKDEHVFSSLPPPSSLYSIEGEYVPMEGDEVSYKVCSIPPKYQKIQAVDVTITHLNPGSKHETWGGALLSSS